MQQIWSLESRRQFGGCRKLLWHAALADGAKELCPMIAAKRTRVSLKTFGRAVGTACLPSMT
jgi:hypothetical protein